MANNLHHPRSNWANRKAKQDFKRRYNRMAENERAGFYKDVDNTGSIIGRILILVFLLMVILRGVLS